MRSIIFSTLLVAFSFQAVGQVTYIQKDTPAPFNGYLFTPERELKIRTELMEKDYLLKQIDLEASIRDNLRNQLTLTEDQTKLWRGESERLAKELTSRRDRSFWVNVGFFGLGVLATVGAAYALKQATK